MYDEEKKAKRALKKARKKALKKVKKARKGVEKAILEGDTSSVSIADLSLVWGPSQEELPPECFPPRANQPFPGHRVHSPSEGSDRPPLSKGLPSLRRRFVQKYLNLGVLRGFTVQVPGTRPLDIVGYSRVWRALSIVPGVKVTEAQITYKSARAWTAAQNKDPYQRLVARWADQKVRLRDLFRS